MAKIEIELDEQILERAKLLAETRKCTLPELIAEVIKLLAAPKVAKDPWMGLFADEPELVGEILEEALRNRAAQSLNQTIGQGTA
jgi:type I restriction-modification system DNA methylase subunit